MPEREVRYCTTEDGVRIAYSVEGEGPGLMILPDFIESFTLEHLLPELLRFKQELGEGRKIVRFDPRGVGLSQREVDDVTHEAYVRDAEAVVRACRVKRMAIWASSASGPTAVEFTARHPRQVSHLILYATFARLADAMARDIIMSYAELCRTNWDVGAQVWADLSHREQFPEAGTRLGEIFKQSTTGDYLAKALEVSYNATDVTHLLPTLRVPTLVLHRRQDSIIPLSSGQRLAAAIPNAKLIVLEGSVHFPALYDSKSIVEAVHAFVREPGGQTRAETRLSKSGPLRTVLFTDLVGHTEMMQRLGDEQGRAVLREHERLTRETLKQHGGAEIKTMGDGFMASFGSVTKAVECAIALQRAFEEHNAGEGARSPSAEGRPGAEALHVRVGLNAGEPIAEEGDLFGSTVILASRVAAQAGAGEILIPEPVRHLLAGKDFLFSDRGDVALKGFEDAVRLYEVRWRE